jgi:hypothetical protein
MFVRQFAEGPRQTGQVDRSDAFAHATMAGQVGFTESAQTDLLLNRCGGKENA